MQPICSKSEISINSSSSNGLNKCIDFIKHIGINVIPVNLTDESFLPGLSIEAGNILIDYPALKYPGDILHEAGHVAVVPAAERFLLNAKTIAAREHHAAEEMMAIAWSYAASIYLNLEPAFVFHDGGYKNGGVYIAGAFSQKQYFGLPMLQWAGLAADEKNAKMLQVDPYPHMIKWLRD